MELLKQLVFVSSRPTPSRGLADGNKQVTAGVPTLLGTGSFSLLSCRWFLKFIFHIGEFSFIFLLMMDTHTSIYLYTCIHI